MTDTVSTSPAITELPPVTVHAMAPTSASPRGAERHQDGLPAPAVVASQVVPKAALRGQKAQFLLNQMLARGVSNQMATAALLPLQFDPDTWEELMSMQTAVVNRLQQQQRDWTQGVTEIVLDYSHIRLANTLSKFVEQEYNLGAQLGALMTSQLSQFVNLMENIQVDYGYWIAQKRNRHTPS